MYAPEALEAELLNGNDVKLTWDAPSAPIDMLTWDNAVYAISIGIDDAADFEVAARFVTTDILDYNGRSLGIVAFFPSEENCDYTVRVWTGGSYGGVINSGNVVAEKVVTDPTIGEWNFVTLDTPVDIDVTQELWIGYRANTQQGMPAGADAGPVVAAKGDLVRFAGGEWASLNTINADFDLNWLIRGVLMPTTVSSEPAIISTSKNQVVDTEFRTEAKKASEATWVGESLFETRNTRAEVTGYKIYRDGSEIATVDGASTLTYTDTGVAGGSHSYYVTALYGSEESEASETVSVELSSGGNETAPAVNGLSSNYPNPFNPTTTISFSVKEDGPVKLEVYNLKGQKVKTLVNDSRKAGNHKVMWEGTDNSNRAVASGFYMYKMSTKNYSSSKKMLLMK